MRKAKFHFRFAAVTNSNRWTDGSTVDKERAYKSRMPPPTPTPPTFLHPLLIFCPPHSRTFVLALSWPRLTFCWPHDRVRSWKSRFISVSWVTFFVDWIKFAVVKLMASPFLSPAELDRRCALEKSERLFYALSMAFPDLLHWQGFSWQ